MNKPRSLCMAKNSTASRSPEETVNHNSNEVGIGISESPQPTPNPKKVRSTQIIQPATFNHRVWLPIEIITNLFIFQMNVLALFEVTENYPIKSALQFLTLRLHRANNRNLRERCNLFYSSYKFAAYAVKCGRQLFGPQYYSLKDAKIP